MKSRKTKRLLAVLLSVCLLTSSFALHLFAETEEPAAETVTNEIYGYSYTTYTDTSGQTVKRYCKEANQTASQVRSRARTVAVVDEYEIIESVLLDLGMDRDALDRFSEEDWDCYVNAESITSTVSYMKTNEDGETVTVDEETALYETRVKKPPITDEDVGIISSNKNTYTDEYMKITFILAQLTGGRYLFSITASWLQMPYWRWTDSLGGCASNLIVVNDTRSGWYSYNMMDGNTGTLLKSVTGSLTESNFQNSINGNWNGTAAKFDVPEDGDSCNPGIAADFKAYVRFEMVVSYPSLALNFNAVATYDHAMVTLNLDPSISIDATGVSASIGLDVKFGSERRTVEFSNPIVYQPE